MYSNKFAAKLVNIRQLCKKIMDNLNIFIVLSTYYFTFRFILQFLWELLLGKFVFGDSNGRVDL